MNKSNGMSQGQRRVLSYYFTRLIIKMALLVIGFGTFYYFAAKYVGEPLSSIIKSYYLMITLIFLNPIIEFPNHLVLQLCFFILPVIGISLLAQGLEKFGKYFFNPNELSKDQLSKELTVLIPTFNNHIVVIGIGQLGYSTVQIIQKMKKPLVVIESNPRPEIEENLLGMGIPIIVDNASKESSLELSGVKNARSIIICTSNDSLNLQIALKARTLNPNIRVVVQIFDEDFADALTEQFGFRTLSASGTAGFSFVAALFGITATNPVSVDGDLINFVHLTVSSGSSLANKTVEWAENNFHANLIYIRQNKSTNMYPQKKEILKSGDELAILSDPGKLVQLIKANIDSAEFESVSAIQNVTSTFRKHTVLIGLNEFGYYIATKLVELSQPVVAIEINTSSDLIKNALGLGVPIIHADATEISSLEAANIKEARAVILATQNDAMNLQIALKVISLNPKIQVVIRVFDDEFALALHDQFGFNALSGTALAAPAFASMALETDIATSISIEGKSLSVTRLTVTNNSPINGKTIGNIERTYRLNILLIKHDNKSDIHPTNNRIVKTNDIITMLGAPEQLKKFMLDNRR